MTRSYRGRTTSSWEQLKKAQRAKRLPCFLCGGVIDYSLQWPHPESFSADHLKPLSRFPELGEDPRNIVSTHLKCNQRKGDNAHFTHDNGVGELSEEF